MKLRHLLFFGIILIVKFSLAATVEKVKGAKSLILLEELEVSEGDMVETFDSSTSKKTAILKVTKVKNGKAIAEIKKGKAKVGQTVQLRGGAKSSETTSGQMPTSKRKSKKSEVKIDSTFAVGGLFGLGMDTMDIALRDQNGVLIESINQTGMGLSFLAAADMDFNDWLSFRATAGLEQFNVKATATNGASPCTSCETEITYFSAMGWGKVNFYSSLWVGLGLGLQQPMSKKTNALDEASIKTSIVYGFAGGADIPMSETWYIPVQVEYGILPDSEDVKASFYSVRAGVMLRY